MNFNKDITNETHMSMQTIAKEEGIELTTVWFYKVKFLNAALLHCNEQWMGKLCLNT